MKFACIKDFLRSVIVFSVNEEEEKTLLICIDLVSSITTFMILFYSSFQLNFTFTSPFRLMIFLHFHAVVYRPVCS